MWPYINNDCCYLRPTVAGPVPIKACDRGPPIQPPSHPSHPTEPATLPLFNRTFSSISLFIVPHSLRNWILLSSYDNTSRFTEASQLLT